MNSSNDPMNVTQNSGGGGRQPVPVGAHFARCSIVAGIGMEETPWGSKPKVIISWDIPSLRNEWETADGRQMNTAARMSSFYNLTFGSSDKPSTLRTHLEGWRGRTFTEDELNGFSLKNILNVPCTLVIQHKQGKQGRIIDFVSAIAPAKDDQVDPLDSGLPVYFSAWEPDMDAYAKLPEWIQKRVDHTLCAAPVQPQQQQPQQQPQEQQTTHTVHPDSQHGSSDYAPIDEDNIPF